MNDDAGKNRIHVLNAIVSRDVEQDWFILRLPFAEEVPPPPTGRNYVLTREQARTLKRRLDAALLDA